MDSYFISFEGIDGAGKSTQIKNLAAYLAGLGHQDVVVTREPGGTDGTKIVRDVFLHHQSSPNAQIMQYLLMIGARADHIDEVIAPALQQNRIVLCDRYIDSTLVYQNEITASSHPELFAIGRAITYNYIPHLTLLLDVEPELALKRIEQRRSRGLDVMERGLTLDLIAKRRWQYLKIAAENSQRVYVLNAMQSQQQVRAEIAAIVEQKLRENHVRA